MVEDLFRRRNPKRDDDEGVDWWMGFPVSMVDWVNILDVSGSSCF